ncbi:MAG: gamma carbonic anhydrase family protein [Myxococcales bacterium]|nr:gamma carbonic anhydrase family protein [Myxococcales bacterium]
MALIRSFNGKIPKIDPTAFVAETAVIIGDVTVGPRASVWYGCILRGDVCGIEVGADTNIQDGTVVHVNHDRDGTGCMPTKIGAQVTIGHRALLHACSLEDRCFVGMDAVVMDGVVVESEAMVAAGALVTPRKRVLPRQLWAGRPAQMVRALREDELSHLTYSSQNYALLAEQYRQTTDEL